MTVNDIPLISFFQRVLDPLIVMGTLYLSALLFHEPFSGYLLVLMVLAFFISSAVYQTWPDCCARTSRTCCS
jgi:putative colanic acid biosynthesis UDP-glucose lipid carrier transferase